MANSQGRIFIDTSTTPPKGVEIADLQHVFGLSSAYLGELITLAVIKKFARFKPIVSSKLGIITANELLLANYGLTAPSANSDIAAVFGLEWAYTKPTGAPGGQFRIRDFINPDNVLQGYNHNATSPVRVLGDITIYAAFQRSYNFTNVVRGASSVEALGWEDFISLSQTYLCVAFSKNANFSGTLLYKTSAVTIANIQSGSSALVLTGNDIDILQSNGYKYYFICSSSTSKPELTTAAISSSFRALPADNASDLTGQLNISTNVLQSFSVPYFSQSASPSAASDFNVASNSVLSCPPYYLHFKVAVTALADSGVTITESGLTLTINGTFVGSSVSVSNLSPRLYDDTFTRVNAITLTAGQTKELYLVIPTQLLALDANGSVQSNITRGQSLMAQAQFYLNGYLMGVRRINAQN